MSKSPGISSETDLPLKGTLRLENLSSILLLVLITVVSVGGILFSKDLYPDEELATSFLSNDILNLIMGLPMLGISLIMTRRKRLVGLLCLPGALFYVCYIYTTYLLGLPLNALFVPYLLLVLFSIIALFSLILKMDHQQILIVSVFMIRRKAQGYSLGMGLLFVMSALFIGLIPVIIIKAVLTGTPVQGLDLIIIGLSSMICFIPLILFFKAVRRTQ